MNLMSSFFSKGSFVSNTPLGSLTLISELKIVFFGFRAGIFNFAKISGRLLDRRR